MARLAKGEIPASKMIDALRQKQIKLNHNVKREEIEAIYFQHFPVGATETRQAFDNVRLKIDNLIDELRDIKVAPTQRTRLRTIIRKLQVATRLAR